jgi:hypothetical protein
MFGPRARYEGLRVVVTGLPRSGTSFVAGMLVRLGLRPGPRWLLRPANRHNPYGYFEHVTLNRVTNRLLRKMGRDFDLNLPAGRAEFEAADLEPYRSEIRRKVRRGKVEVYKDNKLVLYPELYADVFPDARFIFVQRAPDARFESRFGKKVTRPEWNDFNARRLSLWRGSPVSHKALTVEYEDFFDDSRAGVETIAAFLDLDPGEERIRGAADFFRPRRR